MDPSSAIATPRYVFGRYRGWVERLEAHGEARVAVVETLTTPTDDQFTAIYGSIWQAGVASPLFAQFAVVGALPGELVEIAVRWSLPRPGRKRAKRVPPPIVRLLRVIEAAPDRVTPPCPVFGECGGCQLQQMRYDAQLDWKTARVRETLIAAGFIQPLVLPALGCEPPWNYRNHMRFSVNREGEIGLTARGTHRVLPLRSCPIAHPRINDALAILRQTPQPQPQALIRYGDATGQIIFQPTPDETTHQQLQAAGFDVRKGEFEEALHGARFRIRPSSFFQTNTTQANRMIDLTLAALPSGPDVTLVDAYCGVGTFARLLAGCVGRVLAIEESASAIRDARWNLRDAPNMEVIQAKVEERLPQITERLDGLVIDPPRAGCQRPVLDALIARRVPTVVYVSCDPDTLARDLAYLCLVTGAYRLVSVQPLDMFPQTAHIENIVTLVANGAEGAV
ncbi:MAG: class I SAM-dependent RNA methyltransferase [Ktedonobacterales bacterium]